MNRVISRTWNKIGVFYRRGKLRTVEGSIIRKLTIVLWLPACLTLSSWPSNVSSGPANPTPAPTPCRKRFGFCETCINPTYGPAYGLVYGCSWQDALQQLRLKWGARCTFRRALSSNDCLHP